MDTIVFSNSVDTFFFKRVYDFFSNSPPIHKSNGLIVPKVKKTLLLNVTGCFSSFYELLLRDI